MTLFVLSHNDDGERVRRECKNYKDAENAVEDAQEFGETNIRVCVAFIKDGDFVPDFFERFTALGALFAKLAIS